MDPIVLLILFLTFLIVGIAIGLPIGMALIFCGVCTALCLGGSNANSQIIAQKLMAGTDSVTMMALPFFVLAGELMNRGGLTKRIIGFCNIFVGRVKGGLGYVTIFACLMFASLVGSAGCQHSCAWGNADSHDGQKWLRPRQKRRLSCLGKSRSANHAAVRSNDCLRYFGRRFD